MYVDSLGSIGITADTRKIRPGMIYVDLSGRRNRKEIYKAYMNGAAMIFTPQNISDPDLPVIKVSNPRDTLSMLLQRFFTRSGNQTRLIGLVGNGDKRIIIDLIERILQLKGFTEEEGIRNKELAAFSGASDIEGVLERIQVIYAKEADIIPFALDTDSRTLYYYNDFKFDCAVINDIGILEYSQENYNNIKLINEFFANVLQNKTIIINNDDPFAIKAVELCKEVIPITYGLNKKAAVTASSIDIGDTTYFNYCVQRSFKTKNGSLVEPFEMPITMNTIGNHNIYNALAAITCGLYYDVDISKIKNVVEGYRVPERHFEKIYSNSFNIIDNYCNSPSDFKAAFELLQILNYENLYLIISVTQAGSMHEERDKASVISEWARILKCREVLLTSCMDGDMGIQEFPLKNIRAYKKVFKDKGVSFGYYHLLQHAAVHVLRHMQKGDLLVFLGGDEMKNSKSIINHHISIMH